MNVVSVKNGEPERQTAKDCYRIRETGLSSSGMLPARTMRSWKCHAPMSVLPTSSLSSPFRESIAGNADSIKNVGHPWAGGMYGQPVLRCLPDTVKKGFRPTPSRLTAEGHGFKSCPAARKEKPLRWMSQGLFLYSPLFRPAAKPCALPQPSGSRPKHYRSFSTKRVRVSLAASFL